MNIYFACSITGGREYEHIYRELTAALLKDGHEVPTAHLAESSAIVSEGRISPREVYDRDVGWIQTADTLIAEVSVPSHGVGYEVGFALKEGKPVLCLYQKGRKLSKMISGNPDPKLSVKIYEDVDDAVAMVRAFIKDAVQS